MSRRKRLASLLVIGATVLGLSSGASFVLGSTTAQNAESLKESEPVEVWEDVRIETMVQRERWEGSVQQAPIRPIVMPATEAPETMLYTPLRKGTTVNAGDLVAVVSGRPIFGLCGTLALYRELSLNDEGYDVRTLQNALRESGLNVVVDGFMGPRTVNAIQELFAKDGFGDHLASIDAPASPVEAESQIVESTGTRTGIVVPADSFAQLPACTSTVESSAAVGSQLASGDELATVTTQSPTISFTVDLTEGESMVAADELTVSYMGTDFQAEVARVGEAEVDEATSATGQTVYLTSPELLEDAPIGSSVEVSRVTIPDVGADDYVVIPLSAVRADSPSPYVIARTDGGDAAPTKVPVQTVAESDGYVAVQGDITNFDQVKLN